MADQKSRLEWPVNCWPNKFSLSFENDSEESSNFPHGWPTHEQGYIGGWSHVNVLSMGLNRVSRFSAATGSHRPPCRFTKSQNIRTIATHMRNKWREIALGLLFACMYRSFFLLRERFSTIKRAAVDADKPSVSGPPSNQTGQFQSAAILRAKNEVVHRLGRLVRRFVSCARKSCSGFFISSRNVEHIVFSLIS